MFSKCLNKQNIYKPFIPYIITMARLRLIKKYGNSWVISLTSTDITDLNIKEGDMVDIEDMVFKKIKGGNKK